MNALATFIGTFGFIGYLRPAPGTWGSAAALLLWWWMAPLPLGAQLVLIAAVTGIGVLASGRVELLSGREDASEIVIDEVAGMWLAAAGAGTDLVQLGAAFVFFRLFDIWKPGPINRLQSLPGGWGVMADDIAAGALAWPLAYLVAHLI